MNASSSTFPTRKGNGATAPLNMNDPVLRVKSNHKHSNRRCPCHFTTFRLRDLLGGHCFCQNARSPGRGRCSFPWGSAHSTTYIFFGCHRNADRHRSERIIDRKSTCRRALTAYSIRQRLLPEKGMMSGPRWHCEFRLMRVT